MDRLTRREQENISKNVFKKLIEYLITRRTKVNSFPKKLKIIVK
jgi:hypothetical protein